LVTIAVGSEVAYHKEKRQPGTEAVPNRAAPEAKAGQGRKNRKREMLARYEHQRIPEVRKKVVAKRQQALGRKERD
jgi:hypothetical protein